MSDFQNRVATILPGFGFPAQRLSTFDNNPAAGTNTFTLSPAPGLRRGYCRLRTKGSAATPPVVIGTAATTTSLKITASDGTRTYTLYVSVGGIGAANEALDIIVPFNLDIVATSFVATLITAAGIVFTDFEVAGGN